MRSRGEGQTIRLGVSLGGLLQPGSVVALMGELASGKTRLAQGIAGGLGVPDSRRVSSPTFALIHEYGGRIPLYHMDFYRLASGRWEPDLGLEDYLWGEGACVIEWAERILDWLPEDRLEVRLSICGVRTREIAFAATGKLHRELLIALRHELKDPPFGA
jgi:tRNA threonylcarbamoyladenosine biosynthesis protein TsaE